MKPPLVSNKQDAKTKRNFFYEYIYDNLYYHLLVSSWLILIATIWPLSIDGIIPLNIPEQSPATYKF